MGFGTNFCRNMSKRSFQYAVRSTYDLFPGQEVKSKREKKVEPAVDKNGRIVREYSRCIFKGKEHTIKEVCGKMVIFEDGTKHHASSVEVA